MNKCKDCNRDVQWIDYKGKSNLIDMKAKKLVYVFDDQKEAWSLVTGYESHFAHCPVKNMDRLLKVEQNNIKRILGRFLKTKSEKCIHIYGFCLPVAVDDDLHLRFNYCLKCGESLIPEEPAAEVKEIVEDSLKLFGGTVVK